MNRMRSLVATFFAVVFFAASTASAATITFTFYTGVMPDGVTPIVPNLPTNVDQNGAAGPGKLADLCGGGNTDICASELTFEQSGVILTVTASRPGGSTQTMYVNEDLGPVYGGLGVDGGANGTANPGGDNNGPGEQLDLSFSENVRLVSFVSFRDHLNFFEGVGDPTVITVNSNTSPQRLFNVPVGPGAALPNLGNALFTFSPTFAGSIFDFSINAEKFYISTLTIETQNVPEPSSLLMLGMALLGGARAYRRRTAA